MAFRPRGTSMSVNVRKPRALGVVRAPNLHMQSVDYEEKACTARPVGSEDCKFMVVHVSNPFLQVGQHDERRSMSSGSKIRLIDEQFVSVNST